MAVTPNSNSYGGTHIMRINYDDGISVSTDIYYNLEVKFNYPLVVNTTTEVDNAKMIVFTTKNITFNASDLFTDPEA
jgi:hypothetical protein